MNKAFNQLDKIDTKNACFFTSSYLSVNLYVWSWLVHLLFFNTSYCKYNDTKSKPRIAYFLATHTRKKNQEFQIRVKHNLLHQSSNFFHRCVRESTVLANRIIKKVCFVSFCRIITLLNINNSREKVCVAFLASAPILSSRTSLIGKINHSYWFCW